MVLNANAYLKQKLASEPSELYENFSSIIMTQNSTKNLNPWTEKHEKFCYENKLCPCARALWQWLLKHKDDEPDLKEFNSWVSKYRGKPYCRPHLKLAFNQLVECRVIVLVKQFTWHLVRIVTRSLADLFPKKNSRNQRKSYVGQPSNQETTKDEVYNNNDSLYTENDKEQILLECANNGILFNPKKEPGLFKYSREGIAKALNYYSSLSANSKKLIYNPPGWFLTCLEYEYWEYSALNLEQFLLMLTKNTPVRS